MNGNASASFPPEPKEDPEVHYRIVLHDPRLARLRIKYAPKWDKQSCKQRLRNLVDPVNIPFVGIVTSVTRAKTADAHKKEILKMSEDSNNEHLKKTFLMMENGMRRRKVWYTTGAITKTLLLFVPITYIPGAGTALDAVATSIAQPLVAETAENAVKKEQEISAVSEANYKYAATRAFLIYLGLPKTKDDIYHSWEDSRLAIKAIYGAKPKDNLLKQKPSEETQKKLRDMASGERGFNLDELKMSLLALMWWFYECWDEQYFDRFRRKKWKMQESELNHAEDERMVLMMICPLDPKVQMLQQMSIPDILKLMTSATPFGYGNHPRFGPMLGDRSGNPAERKKFVSTLKCIINKFINRQSVWGYYEESGALSAVIFYEKAEGRRILLGQTYGKGKLVTKSLNSDVKNQHLLLMQEEHEIVENMPPASGVLHLFAAADSPAGHHGLMTLIKSAAEYTSSLSFACEYSNQKQRIELLKECKFSIKTSTDMLTSLVLKPPPRNREDYTVSQRTFDRLSKAGINY